MIGGLGEEVLPNVIFDYSKDGKVISIEIFKAKKTLEALEKDLKNLMLFTTGM